MDNSLRTFDVYSEDLLIKGNYPLKWRAKFKDHNPSYYVEAPFTLKMLSICSDNVVLNVNTPVTTYHLIEDPTPTIASWTLWKTKRPGCIKSTAYTLAPSMTELTPDWVNAKISISATPGTTKIGIV